MCFGGDVSAYAKKTGLTINEAVVSICAEATERVIKKTPHDTGRARGNWFASINTVSNETDEGRRETEAIAQGVKLAKKAPGKIFNLTNNLPYIGKLEFGGYPKTVKFGTRLNFKKMSAATKKSGVRYEVRTINGFSIQAPAGMVRVTAVEIDKQLKDFAK